MDTIAVTHPLLGEPASHRAVREGTVAGMVGAASVALWFLVIDLVTGQPFHTPAVLGTAVMNTLGWPVPGPVVPVLIYTLFHLAAFSVVGTIAVVLVHTAHREASVLLAMVILFVAFEGGFYLLLYVLDLSLIGSLAWMQIAPANLVAAALMGGYLWRTHPALHRHLREGLSGRGSM